MTSQDISLSESFCTFRIDHQLFGVEVQKVQEVIRTQQTTCVPLAPSVIHGLMNLRGQIVSALDLRQRLGMSPNEEIENAMNVVIRSSEEPVSLLVDEIGDVINVSKNSFEPPPETLQGNQREFILGAFKLDDGLLLILDTDRVLRFAA